MLYQCREVLDFVAFASAQERSWRSHGVNVQELRVPREDKNRFALGKPFHLCFSHTQYVPAISCDEKRLLEIVERKGGG